MSEPLLEIDVNSIDVPEIKLRAAKTETADFEHLANSIAANGILQSLLVQVSPANPDRYLLVNGLQRLTIARNLGIEAVPCMVTTADQLKSLSLQIEMNLQTIATRPAEYGRMLQEMLILQPTLTVVDLANRINRAPQWINERIGLNKLLPAIAARVDAGDINATSAIKLSRLSEEEQLQFLDRAISMPVNDFVQVIDARLEELKEARKTGKEAKAPEFTPVARLRTRADLVAEANAHTARAALVTEDMNNADAFDLAVLWVLQLDPESVSIEKERWDTAKAAAEAKKAKAAAEREAKKAAAATSPGANAIANATS